MVALCNIHNTPIVFVPFNDVDGEDHCPQCDHDEYIGFMQSQALDEEMN